MITNPNPTRGYRSLFRYSGSEKGRETLNSLDMVKCQCGTSNMVDHCPTSLGQRCTGCGKVVA